MPSIRGTHVWGPGQKPSDDQMPNSNLRILQRVLSQFLCTGREFNFYIFFHIFFGNRYYKSQNFNLRKKSLRFGKNLINLLCVLSQ